MKALYIFVSLFLLSALTLAAERVESVAGTLKSLISNTDITTLSVGGSINAADLDFINNDLTHLAALDLSAARIEAYTGAPLSNGRTTSAANLLPEYSLMGLPVVDLKLPESLESMGEGCLAGSAITAIVVPAGVNTIGVAAFDGCASLASVTLPASIRTIPALAFKGCTSLRAIAIPDGVESTGTQAFKGCTALEHVIMPSSLSLVGDETFNNCTSLCDINFPAAIESIGADAFNATALPAVDLSECTRLKSTGHWAFGHCASLATAVLPESLTTVGDGLFFDCTQLETVTMPASLTSLAPYMFKGTALTTADGVITEATQSIERYALYGNDRITVIKLPAAVASLGDKAMAGMSSLEMLDATALSELPVIGEDVFAGTASDDVTLLASSEMAPVFETTPQWQEFNVVIDGSTGADAPLIDASRDAVELMCDGNTLYIKTSRTLNDVALYDTAGVAVARVAAHGSTSVELSTNNVPRGVVIVLLNFTDNTHATIKTKI